MSFFDVPARPPEPPPVPEPQRPDWAGPPRGVLPGLSTQRAVVFRTDRAYLAVSRILVYSNGIEFTLDLELRYPDHYPHDLPWEVHALRRPGPPPDDFLRLGLLLSDGTQWTNLDWRPRRPDQDPDRPVVMSRRSGGGGGSFEMTYWMWPLPPAGPLTIVSEWPSYGIAETRIVVDATELRSRAAEAQPLWLE